MKNIAERENSYVQGNLILALVALLVAAHAQSASPVYIDPAASVEKLATCTKPRWTVAVEEETTETLTRLAAEGVSQKLGSLVEDVLTRSGCFILKPDAIIKVRARISSVFDQQTTVGAMVQKIPASRINDVRAITADTLISLIDGKSNSEEKGTGQVEVQLLFGQHHIVGPKGAPMGIKTKIETYGVALTLALENALNKLLVSTNSR